MIVPAWFPLGSHLVPKVFEKASGRLDLNRRTPDPQARNRCLARSERVEMRATHLRQCSADVAVGRDESGHVGSLNWLP